MLVFISEIPPRGTLHSMLFAHDSCYSYDWYDGTAMAFYSFDQLLFRLVQNFEASILVEMTVAGVVAAAVVPFESE